jgi:hypothetical protein
MSERHKHCAVGCCAACGRFIGPYPACPYCDVPPIPSPTRRALKLLAITLTITGLTLLATLAHITPAPLTDAAHITPRMNFARITLHGHITEPPRIGRSRQWAKIHIEANGIPITMRIGPEPAAACAEVILTRQPGDPVVVTGQLRLKPQDRHTLYITRAAHLAFPDRKEPQ